MKIQAGVSTSKTNPSKLIYDSFGSLLVGRNDHNTLHGS